MNTSLERVNRHAVASLVYGRETKTMTVSRRRQYTVSIR